MLITGEKDFALNDEEPQLIQIIFPAKDRSETKLELPQLIHTLFRLIFKLKNKRIFFINYIIKFEMLRKDSVNKLIMRIHCNKSSYSA